MAREWRYDSRNRRNWPFLGIDGEGGDIPDESLLFGTRHVYQLLRAGESVVEDPGGLRFERCAEFLCDLPRNCIYVGYFFDYDVTMILRDIPQERAERLMHRNLREMTDGWGLMPVDVGPYQIDYLPHKEFKIRRKGTGEPFTIINDVGQFFQAPFLKTLEKWKVGTPDEWDAIRRGKKMRSEFTFMTDEIREYNALEIRLLEELMYQFREVCEDTGYLPKKWQGPGYLASAMLDHHEVPKRNAIPIMRNEEFKRLANDAYYGGRFETTATGPVAGPVYQYDINSAYPAILRTLPCLHHGSWRRIYKMPDSGVWFGQVSFTHDPGRYLNNLPFRDKHGNISFPKDGNGVYWSSEIRAAIRAGTQVGFLSGWEYERHCTCQWFSWVDAYYEYRLTLGKSAKGMVLKLGGNSIYGKMAQSIGYAPYANPVWAGMITAGCRAMLIDAYSQAPDQTYMLATDGLFTGVPLDVPVSTRLGDWDETYHADGMFIVQPGIYFLPRPWFEWTDPVMPSSLDVKTRGVERGRISGRRRDFEAAWAEYLRTQSPQSVTVDVENFITMKQALARRKWRIAGTWEAVPREISFDWSTKRVAGMAWDDGRALRTMPLPGDPAAVSLGYERVIGGELRMSGLEPRFTDVGLLESERMSEQPDWVSPLFESL